MSAIKDRNTRHIPVMPKPGQLFTYGYVGYGSLTEPTAYYRIAVKNGELIGITDAGYTRHISLRDPDYQLTVKPDVKPLAMSKVLIEKRADGYTHYAMKIKGRVRIIAGCCNFTPGQARKHWAKRRRRNWAYSASERTRPDAIRARKRDEALNKWSLAFVKRACKL